jgi:hypothetical protein
VPLTDRAADQLGEHVVLAPGVVPGRDRLDDDAPAVGASDPRRQPEQLTANLGALDVRLPAEALRRLDEASAISLGFPHDFIGSTTEFVYGPVDRDVVSRTAAR